VKYNLLLSFFLQNLLICIPVFSMAGGLSERLAGFASINESRGSFRESWMADYLNEPLVSTGTLSYKRPGELTKFITSPERIEQYIEGNQLSIRKKGETRYMSLSEQPELAVGILALQAMLDGDEKKLRMFFTVQYTESRAGWELILTPENNQMAERIEQIVLQGEESVIRRVSVQFLNGNKRLTEIMQGH